MNRNESVNKSGHHHQFAVVDDAGRLAARLLLGPTSAGSAAGMAEQSGRDVEGPGHNQGPASAGVALDISDDNLPDQVRTWRRLNLDCDLFALNTHTLS